MSENIDAPVVIRRRRKIIRHTREKTPEPTIRSGGLKTKYSDDESSSTAEQNIGSSRPKMKSVSTGTGISVHRSKILSRRDKGIGTSVRSQSTPRVESNQENIETLVSNRPTKHRSLSSPRYVQFNIFELKFKSNDFAKSIKRMFIFNERFHFKLFNMNN